MGADWLAKALCHTAEDKDLWFPEDENGVVDEEREAKARAFCGVCPVREECLEYSYSFGFPMGIWAGLNAEERRREKRNQQSRKSRQRQARERTVDYLKAV